jgi:predicted cupin superfamily sugar epimerase
MSRDGRPIRVPTPEEIKGIVDGIKSGLDVGTAAMAVGIAKRTAERWYYDGEKEQDARDNGDAEGESVNAQTRIDFWRTCAKAYSDWARQPATTLQRALVGGKVETKTTNPDGSITERTVYPPGMSAVSAAQFMLEKRVPAYKRKSELDLGGQENGHPVKVDMLTRIATGLPLPTEDE